LEKEFEVEVTPLSKQAVEKTKAILEKSKRKMEEYKQRNPSLNREKKDEEN
jgi:hypothetical protein